MKFEHSPHPRDLYDRNSHPHNCIVKLIVVNEDYAICQFAKQLIVPLVAFHFGRFPGTHVMYSIMSLTI
jgi:hypothetical protein